MRWRSPVMRSEEHTSELQSHSDLVCRLLLEKKPNMHFEDHTSVFEDCALAPAVCRVLRLLFALDRLSHRCLRTCCSVLFSSSLFFLNDTPPPEISPFPLPAALPT